MEEELIKDAECKMKNSMDHLLHELGKLRTGQASVATDACPVLNLSLIHI